MKLTRADKTWWGRVLVCISSLINISQHHFLTIRYISLPSVDAAGCSLSAGVEQKPRFETSTSRALRCTALATVPGFQMRVLIRVRELVFDLWKLLLSTLKNILLCSTGKKSSILASFSYSFSFSSPEMPLRFFVLHTVDSRIRSQRVNLIWNRLCLDRTAFTQAPAQQPAISWGRASAGALAGSQN